MKKLILSLLLLVCGSSTGNASEPSSTFMHKPLSISFGKQAPLGGNVDTEINANWLVKTICSKDCSYTWTEMEGGQYILEARYEHFDAFSGKRMSRITKVLLKDQINSNYVLMSRVMINGQELNKEQIVIWSSKLATRYFMGRQKKIDHEAVRREREKQDEQLRKEMAVLDGAERYTVKGTVSEKFNGIVSKETDEIFGFNDGVSMKEKVLSVCKDEQPCEITGYVKSGMRGDVFVSISKVKKIENKKTIPHSPEKLREITVKGYLFTAQLDSSIENDEGRPSAGFLNKSEAGEKIFSICSEGDICEVTGMVKGSEYGDFFVTVSKVKNLNP